jgi:hypothetical protein
MALLMLLLSSLLLMPSCEKEEVNNDPLLQSFGPSPALRGGELRFIGQNLGEVTAVIFPGVTGGTVQVTDIITVNEREIKVMIPQDAGVGILTLVTTSGEIKTLTPLTFSEPISISKVSPLKVKAGETLTIEGDYLNLIKRVIFVDNVAVEAGAFLPGQTRKKLQVTVPAEAQSGKIIISNGEEIPIEVYSESDLEVVLPSVAAPADLTGKKPGEVIEIAGSDFDLVVSLLMPNGDEVPFEVIETEAGEAIRFTLPANMTDGVVIVLPASGVEVAIANIGLALPANVVATPATGLRAGDLITLEGLNMELVTSLTFPGVAEAVEPESKTATEVTVTMPDAATSGNLLLNTGSGVSVEVAIETLKPTFTAYENSTVPLGDNVVITGEDLDLVSRVQFTGGAEVEVSSSSPASLTVAMPTMNVESGILTLFMANGESVEIESLTIEAPLFAFIPILPGEEEEIKAGGLFGIEVTNLDKLTTVKVNDAEVKFIVAGNMMYITIPQIAANATKLTLVSSNGSIDYTLNVMPMGQIENVVYHGPLNLDWGTYTIAPDAFVDFTNGTVTLKITYAVTGDGDAQIKFYNGHWEQMLQRFNDGNDTYLFDPNSNVVEFELTQEELVMLQTLTDWGQSMIFHGQGVVINNIVAVYKQALETTVWSGDVDLAAFTLNYEVKPPSIFLDADVKAGMTLRIYVDSYGPEPMLQFFNGHWERIYGDISIDATNSAVWSDNVISLPIDAAIAANLREYIDWGYCLIVQGQDCILKKITIE